MIKFIVKPMSIARSNTIRALIVHNRFSVTSTAKESGVGAEAVKNCFGNLLRDPWREINIPRFFEIIKKIWSSSPCIIPTLIFICNNLVILRLRGIIIVLICWYVTEHHNILASSFGSFNLVFPYLYE